MITEFYDVYCPTYCMLSGCIASVFFVFVFFYDQIKKDEFGGSCKGEEEKYIQGFGGKTCRKETIGKSQVKMGE
jgi:hypothetical protein